MESLHGICCHLESLHNPKSSIPRIPGSYISGILELPGSMRGIHIFLDRRWRRARKGRVSWRQNDRGTRVASVKSPNLNTVSNWWEVEMKSSSAWGQLPDNKWVLNASERICAIWKSSERIWLSIKEVLDSQTITITFSELCVRLPSNVTNRNWASITTKLTWFSDLSGGFQDIEKPSPNWQVILQYVIAHYALWWDICSREREWDDWPESPGTSTLQYQKSVRWLNISRVVVQINLKESPGTRQIFVCREYLLTILSIHQL
jgi:hypothetical protein